jgi:hypothetical protein
MPTIIERVQMKLANAMGVMVEGDVGLESRVRG